MQARILSALATLLLIWHHCCWCLFWVFVATACHHTKFVFLCKLIPGSGFFCHTAEWGWCTYMLYLEMKLFQSRVDVQCWILFMLCTICEYILVEMASMWVWVWVCACSWARQCVCAWVSEWVSELTDMSKWVVQMDVLLAINELHPVSCKLSEDWLKLQLHY